MELRQRGLNKQLQIEKCKVQNANLQFKIFNFHFTTERSDLALFFVIKKEEKAYKRNEEQIQKDRIMYYIKKYSTNYSNAKTYMVYLLYDGGRNFPHIPPSYKNYRKYGYKY